MANKIHYIDPSRLPVFIIATTRCGIPGMEVGEYTTKKAEVTCKTCLRSLEADKKKQD